MPDPGTAGIAVGGSLLSGAFSSRESRRASDRATRSSERSLEATIDESARQFDIVRSDTEIRRQVGDRANIALGYLLGIRQPPSQERINDMTAKLQMLENDHKGRHQFKIDHLREQLEIAQDENDIANEMGALSGQVPDLNTLFSDVEIPSASDFLEGLGEDLVRTESYRFEMQQGRQALNNFLSSRGTAYGGNAIKAAIEYGQDYARTKRGERFQEQLQRYDVAKSEAIDKYRLNLDRYNLAKQAVDTTAGQLLSASGQGAGAVSQSAAAGAQHASQVGAATGRHAGTVADAAYTRAQSNIGAVNQIANTGMTMYMYNQMMNQPTPTPTTPARMRPDLILSR